MSESEKSLKEISIESLETLRDRFKIDWRKHILAFYYVDGLLKKYKNHEEFRELTKIYSINGEVREDATFVGDILNKNLVIATLDDSFENLRALLNLIDFSIPRNFVCVNIRYRNFVHDFISCDKSLKTHNEIETYLMHLKKEEALKFEVEVPKNFQLRSLSVDDANLVRSTWKFASILNKHFVEYSIKYNLNVGLYNQKNELVAWCLLNDFGTLLHLFTLEAHRRKGYAELIIKAISKKFAFENGDVVTSIMIDNFASLSLFSKLGFKEIDRTFSLGVEKKN